MVSTTRITLALCTVCLALLAFASTALAAEPATVTVTVEGLSETKLAPKQATTTTTPVVKDGNPAHSCAGTTAIGALEQATGGDWGGPWNEGFKQYEIFSIEGENHEFEPSAAANYFWSFWLNDKESLLGACEAQLQTGDRVLFFPSCFGSACPPAELPLGIEAPAVAGVNESVTVTVKRYNSSGEAAPAANASVTGAMGSAVTESAGHATVSFSAPGEYMLHTTAPESVRAETAICVHAGNDGACGTTAATTTSSTSKSSSSAGGEVAGFKVAGAAPYKGPYALVAHMSGLVDGRVYGRREAPRVLAGSIFAHSAVSSIALELRREHKGRCSAYSGVKERFIPTHCGAGSFFTVSSNDAFSYLLPSVLAPGRYVLDTQASDLAGNHTTLARGTSRIIFYVR